MIHPHTVLGALLSRLMLSTLVVAASVLPLGAAPVLGRATSPTLPAVPDGARVAGLETSFLPPLSWLPGQGTRLDLGVTGDETPAGPGIAVTHWRRLANSDSPAHARILPERPAYAAGACPGQGPGGQIRVEFTGATYPVASGGTTGFFETGQDADIMLSGIDFNNTGGALLFNHPAGIASDGTHLLLADRFNNRVLIWNSLPTGNQAPDLVLGQPDFTDNDPGTGLDRLNWPGQVAVAPDGRVVVADTENHRLLIWNTFPTRNGQPADRVLNLKTLAPVGSGGPFEWPWGVWTDGQRLAAAVTRGASLLIWNQFPTQDNQPYDLLLTGQGQLGTPRTITSDGHSLIVGDHNPGVTASPSRTQGNFFWKAFPTTNEQPYDFFMSDPRDPNYAWMQGDFTADGKPLLLGRTLHLWNTFPADASDLPDLSITGYDFQGGDGADLTVAVDRVYISLYNGNKVVAYNAVPGDPNQAPDFAIGSPDICTNTLETNFFITNPVIASNGTSLFVSSDFDNKLHVWKQIPDRSGAHPDIVYRLPESFWDNAVWGNTFALAGRGTVYIWTRLPLNGELPDRIFQGRIGSVSFQNLQGVAVDDRYFYLADVNANKVYIWEGIPTQDAEPKWVLDVNQPRRLSSDGTYLAVATTFEHSIKVYRIADLGFAPAPTVVGRPGMFNLPEGATVAGGHLFVADTGFHRVLAWSDIADALAGNAADVVLGEENLDDHTPEIGRDKLFWPASVSFDGTYLWVGEFKFSNRILRFSPAGQVGRRYDFLSPPGIGVEDVQAVAGHWRSRLGDGTGLYDPLFDLDGDDDNDVVDIMRVAARWGETCTPTWTELAPASKPAARYYNSLAYDAQSRRVILFGGAIPNYGAIDDNWGAFPIADTWAHAPPDPPNIGGAGGANTWSKRDPATSPSPRMSHTTAYDAQSDRVILFGGGLGDGTRYDDTWAYDFESDTWSQMAPPTSPVRREAHGLAYDAQSDRVILFGGVATLEGSWAMDDTWAYDYDTDTWTQMNPTTRPAPRFNAALAYDTESDRAILFGGGAADQWFDDTWAYAPRSPPTLGGQGGQTPGRR